LPLRPLPNSILPPQINWRYSTSTVPTILRLQASGKGRHDRRVAIAVTDPAVRLFILCTGVFRLSLAHRVLVGEFECPRFDDNPGHGDYDTCIGSGNHSTDVGDTSHNYATDNNFRDNPSDDPTGPDHHRRNDHSDNIGVERLDHRTRAADLRNDNTFAANQRGHNYATDPGNQRDDYRTGTDAQPDDHRIRTSDRYLPAD
jgi:hypothetical protein